MNNHRRTGASGFSLIEALVAISLMTSVALSGVAMLIVARRANLRATTTAVASLLAEQKMEQLRALAWAFDVNGQPLTDATSDVTVVPQLSSGGVGIAASAAGALQQNANQYCDFLDERGRSLGGGTSPPPRTVYVRRWAIEPWPANPANAVVLQVVVMRWRNIA